ncbi:hypothetical protein BO71DRAFT_398954 [Aspergillus ellipticus CBS 707.79]|uniref:Enoyl reductase (ER) domain-containing protein n=1 Tax=Aspergillus ellipticus CBS 707.79 TaxID=1448320 RepID=A0A319DAK5_9EURO|nr:hypothetical protein BO71DRAFT_398954 [Aspergillus ellipticus CBS 707.79]
MANRSIWLGEDKQLSIRKIEDSYEPLAHEVLVEVSYSGINPADVSHGRVGFNNCVAGYDFAGTVIKAGSARQDTCSPGEKVLGFAAPLLQKPKQYGAHQKYHCARHFIYHVPPSMPMPEAACLMVVTHTAADALFNQLALPFGDSQLPILIWGASAAVGTAAVQFAKMAGCFPILATASSKNHEALYALGATECFDYRDPDVVEKVKMSVQRHTENPLQRVLDCVVSRGKPSSTELCEAIADIGARFTSPVTASYAAKQQWRRTFACRNVDVDFPLPDGTLLKHEAMPDWQANIDRATKWAIEHYGQGYCMPRVNVVHGGEEGMKAMLHVVGGGASMEKYVIQHPI